MVPTLAALAIAIGPAATAANDAVGSLPEEAEMSFTLAGEPH